VSDEVQAEDDHSKVKKEENKEVDELTVSMSQVQV